MMRISTLLGLLLAVAALPAFGQSQLSVDIKEGNPSATPIAIVPFGVETAGLPPETDVAAVISADFNRSGQFRALPRQDIVELPTRSADVKYPTWNVLKQNYLVVGRVLDAEAGAYSIEFELMDVPKQKLIRGVRVSARPNDLRGAAHQIADIIYEEITKVRGAFWTRIAYVTSTGTGQSRQYSLMVADSDGYNPQTVVRSREPLLSPNWSPDGKRLAYV
ncbi:MAG TPA: Tol-Pal system protein TolB, partial [Xanthomonadales bacterium]|nr:Tol-Pal system protein TolB [Xanthomonadales bacterium]